MPVRPITNQIWGSLEPLQARERTFEQSCRIYINIYLFHVNNLLNIHSHPLLLQVITHNSFPQVPERSRERACIVILRRLNAGSCQFSCFLRLRQARSCCRGGSVFADIRSRAFYIICLCVFCYWNHACPATMSTIFFGGRHTYLYASAMWRFQWLGNCDAL